MWTIRRLAATVLVAAGCLIAVFGTPVHAEDLDCGDPGVGTNFRVDPHDDPNGFDRDNDGIGCETREDGHVTAPAPLRAELARTGPDQVAMAAESLLGVSLIGAGVVALRASRARAYRPRHLARTR